jgi:hypothetical protein
MAAVDVHLYKDYVLCVAPQSHFGSCPYALFRRESLEYVGMVGAFGHSSQEFMDVNPYYLGNTGDSFIQCTDGNIRTEIKIENDVYSILSKESFCTRALNIVCPIDDNILVTDDTTGESELELYNRIGKTFTPLLDYPNDIAPLQDKDDLMDYYAKTVSYNEETNDLYCFYVNIPVVRIVNIVSKKETDISLDAHFIPEENEQAYREDENKIRYTSSRYINGKIYALYQAGEVSEIHVWNQKGRPAIRLSIGRHIKCFDITEDEAYIYSISEDSDGDKILKFKL